MKTSEHARYRVGIFGGTFDPPHNGHIAAVRAFLSALSLDALDVMPAGIPPHRQKRACTASNVRLMMAHAAFDGVDPRVSVSDYELNRPTVSYTWETVEHFALGSKADIYFLCGADKFLTMDTWRCPERLFSCAAVACMLRESNVDISRAVAEKSAFYREKYHARIHLVSGAFLELSSSTVRQMQKDGGDISALVPPEVRRVMDFYQLYRGETIL